MKKVKLIDRREYTRLIIKHGSSTKTIETVNYSVIENYDKNGIMFASAEYIKIVGLKCQVNYRLISYPH